eukprot:487865-Hanusia_phi.AAC.1
MERWEKRNSDTSKEKEVVHIPGPGPPGSESAGPGRGLGDRTAAPGPDYDRRSAAASLSPISPESQVETGVQGNLTARHAPVTAGPGRVTRSECESIRTPTVGLCVLRQLKLSFRSEHIACMFKATVFQSASLSSLVESPPPTPRRQLPGGGSMP